MLLTPHHRRGRHPAPAAPQGRVRPLLALAIALAAAVAGQPVGAAGPAPSANPALRTAPAVPAAAGPAAPAAAAAAAPPVRCERLDVGPMVQMAVGKSTVIRPAVPVKRILLGNPDNARAARPAEADEARKPDTARSTGTGADADRRRPGVADVDVLLLGPNELYLLGRSIGSTNIVVLDRDGGCTAFDVVVSMDTAALQAVLRQLLPGETGIVVSAAFDAVVLSGQVSDSEALTRATDLAQAFVRGQRGAGTGGTERVVNLLAVDAPQQVMLEVKVAEISKNLLDQFGIDFSRAYAPGDGSMLRFLNGILGGGVGSLGQISGTGPRGVPFSSVDAVVGGTLPAGSAAVGGNVTATYDSNGRPTYTTSYGTVPGRGVTGTTLNMQKIDGLVKVLAEPSVMAISGQTGSFLAGGKVYLPVSQGDGLGGRSVTLEEKEFGVSVKFTPTVLGGGRINLRVRPEVSELNPTGITVTGAGSSSLLPTFTTRKAETTVQLMDGQSFAIGGLIKNNTTTNIKAFPFLGETPVLGALFRSTEFQTDRSELVFVITPRLVKPLPADYRLPTDQYQPPSRQELILEGRTEGRPPAAGTPKDAR